MELKTIKKILYAITYGIFGFIIGVILIRIILQLIGANPSSDFVSYWYKFSDNFLTSFKGIYPSFSTYGSFIYIQSYSIVGIVFYLLISVIVSKALTSVVDSNPVTILKNITDTMFKAAEFFLILRFAFKLTGASLTSTFVDFIYTFSSFIHEPFIGILPTFGISKYNIVFETSTLIAIAVIIIFDLITEGVIDKIAKAFADDKSHTPVQKTGFHSVSHAPTTHAKPQPIQYIPQQPANITVNVPQQQQQPVAQQPPAYIDNRTVKVYPNANVPNTLPPQPQTRPGYGQNHLENQRPIPNQQAQGGHYQQPPVQQPNAVRNPNQGG